MTITINKSEVLNEVEKRSSLEGFVQPDNFDKMWASSEVAELLESYWIEGYTSVIQLLKRYLTSNSVVYNLESFNQSEVLSISLEMPERYNDLLDGSVTNSIKMFIACNMLGGWLGVISPGAASKYREESGVYEDSLRSSLLYRDDPDNASSEARKDSDAFEEGADLNEGISDQYTFDVEDCIYASKTDDVLLEQKRTYCGGFR